jgi:hypothetical protein
MHKYTNTQYMPIKMQVMSPNVLVFHTSFGILVILHDTTRCKRRERGGEGRGGGEGGRERERERF